MAAATFTSALWGMPGGEPGTLTSRDELTDLYVSIFTTPANTCEWVRADDLDHIVTRLVALDERAQAAGSGNVYIGATLTRARDQLPRDEDGGPRKRPHAVDAAAMVAVWIDIDVVELGNHGGKPYPPTLEAAWAVIARLPIRPTLVLHTGHGLQAWWILHEPWRFADEGDAAAEEAARTRAAELSRDWVHTVRLHAEDAGGWTVDPVFDLARLMRPAGTTNRKAEPKPVRVVEGPGRTYDVEDIVEALADPKVLERYRTPRIGPEELGGIDLHRCWSRATSLASRERGFTPPWVEAFNEAVDTSPLAAAWEDGYDHDDPSTVDARLTRWLFDRGCTTEQVCEAIMCLRLRTGHKPDKVDPNRRTDYLITTVGKFRATSEAAKAKRSLGERAAAYAAGQRVGEGDQAPAPRPAGAAPATPEPVAPRASDPGQAGRDDDAPQDITAAVTAAVRAPQPHDARARTDGATPDDGAAGATREDNDAPGGEDTPASGPGADSPATATPPPGDDDAGAGHDQVAQDALDRVRHPADAVGGWASGQAPRATPPPVAMVNEPSASDPFGKRSEIEEQLMGELTRLLINPVFAEEGCEVWRVEQRNTGPKAEGRIVLRIPTAFAFVSGPPPGYRPGRPYATGWRPRSEFESYKGFHQSLKYDVKISAREVAPKGTEVQEHQVDQGSWRAMLEAMVPYWRQDSSGTDLASAVPEWLFTLLTERPALPDVDEALSTGRPWLAQPGGWSAEHPPRIMITRSHLMEYLAAQPGSTGPGPTAGSLLELLALTPRRVRTGGTHVRRARWLEVDADQFDTERWTTIIDDTASALRARERQQDMRKGLRLVADGDRDSSATEEMRARLAEHDVTVTDQAAVGEPGGLTVADPNIEGDR